MKTYVGSFFLLLTILLRMEYFALDGTSAHDTCPSYLADKEWVHDGKIPEINEYFFIEELLSLTGTPIHATSSFTDGLHSYLQPCYYPDKLQLSDGYIFVSINPNRSNIPHQNCDEEDPAILLG